MDAHVGTALDATGLFGPHNGIDAMEAYATALSYAIPGFVVLIIIEQIAVRVMGKHLNRSMDVISSLSSGMTLQLLARRVSLLRLRWCHKLYTISILTRPCPCQRTRNL